MKFWWLVALAVAGLSAGCAEKTCEEMDASECASAEGCSVAFGFPYDSKLATCFGSKIAIGCFESDLICTQAVVQGTAADGSCYQVADGCNAAGGGLVEVEHCSPNPALCQTMPITQCSQLAEVDCGTSPFCDPVRARPYNTESQCYEAGVFVGCRPAGPCADAIAHAENTEGVCHEFSQTDCYPQGQTWVTTEVCGTEDSCE